jgi:hypothetical protein
VIAHSVDVHQVIQLHICLASLKMLAGHLFLPLTPVTLLVLLGVVVLKFRFLRSIAITCALIGAVVGLSLTGRLPL